MDKVFKGEPVEAIAFSEFPYFSNGLGGGVWLWSRLDYLIGGPLLDVAFGGDALGLSLRGEFIGDGDGDLHGAQDTKRPAALSAGSCSRRVARMRSLSMGRV